VLRLVLDSIEVIYFELVALLAVPFAKYRIEYNHHHKPVASVGSTGQHFVTLAKEQSITNTTNCDADSIHAG
jgi:hypothetical protein